MQRQKTYLRICQFYIQDKGTYMYVPVFHRFVVRRETMCLCFIEASPSRGVWGHTPQGKKYFNPISSQKLVPKDLWFLSIWTQCYRARDFDHCGSVDFTCESCMYSFLILFTVRSMVGLPTCQIVECDELPSGIRRGKCQKFVHFYVRL